VLVLLVTVHVKPEHASEFVEAAVTNATRSAADEPGCRRFDVIRDRDDPNCLYYYEVYDDDAALASHRQTPHFKAYAEKIQPWLAAPPERRLGTPVTKL
jgi:(4S)-4-hydroxy-5-phosphonooxypentane-2,3-dione isomerase